MLVSPLYALSTGIIWWVVVFPHAVDTLLEQSFAPETLEKILWTNTARLYGMD